MNLSRKYRAPVCTYPGASHNRAGFLNHITSWSTSIVCVKGERRRAAGLQKNDRRREISEALRLEEEFCFWVPDKWDLDLGPDIDPDPSLSLDSFTGGTPGQISMRPSPPSRRTALSWRSTNSLQWATRIDTDSEEVALIESILRVCRISTRV
mmetsp:Transcript_7303/g.7523  ORF Transcript_7303/g.7523 Transcript_7303/m.7523 type:complete len:153 (-) Transcript_7303:186-644(-)